MILPVSGLTHEPDCLTSRPYGVGHEPEVYKRGLVAVTVFVLRAGRRVLHHCHFETVLQKVPEVIKR
jgi:hypothetical protein